MFGRRILIAELDSMAQRARFDSRADATAIRELTGMVRTAYLLSDRIVVTDAMLLDGIYFMHMTPDRIAVALGVAPYELPMTVLSGFHRLGDALEAKRSSREQVWQTGERGDVPGWADRVTSAQRQWIESAEAGAFAIEPFADPVEVRADGGFVRSVPDPDWVAALPAGPAALLTQSLTAPSRSAFEIARDRSVAALDGQGAAGELEAFGAVADWWRGAYLDEVAERNGVDWIRFDGAADSAVVRNDSEVSGQGRRHFLLAGSVVDHVREMPPGAFGAARYAARASREAFMERQTPRRLRGLAFSVVAGLTAPRRGRVLAASVSRLALAAAVVVVSLPFLPSTLWGMEVAWLAFGAAVVATVPWQDLMTIATLTNPRGAAELSVVAATRVARAGAPVLRHELDGGRHGR
ncbi:hypothetical protein JOE59_000381 [Agromyces cerinus]|uniref:hypothetical protein n=1 Tax=Agromyces cerinus TaxID=33878 RepID=UPI00195C28A6|nr:hypothetical protein [Agromyces cerinus]MBM7829676.1 hypothetical protein [Agromyces cerinus]